MGRYAARILNGQFGGNKHHFIIASFCADSKSGISFWIRQNLNKLSKFLAQLPKGGLRPKSLSNASRIAYTDRTTTTTTSTTCP